MPRVSVLSLALWLLMLTVHVQMVATEVPVAKLCYIVRPSNGATVPFLVSRYAVDLYRSQFPQYNWTVVPIAQNINAAVRDAVQAMVTTGEQCHGVLGPGSSSYSLALSPVVDMPWVDFASTSVELSDKSVYTWFNRVITTDAQIGSAMADVIHSFGWKVINMLSSNEAYGTSVSQQLVASMVAGGGSIAISQSMQVTSGLTDVQATFDLIERSAKSRIIAVGIPSGSVLFASLVNVTLTRRLHEKYVFLFSESACSGDAQWRTIPGALCVTFRTNATLTSSFLSSYTTRDTSIDVAVLRSYNRTQSIASIANTFNIFAAFAHDASLLLMTALSEAPSISNRTDLLARLRNTVISNGFSGRIQLDSSGNRLGASMQVLNVNAQGSEVPVGVMMDHLVNRVLNGSDSPTPVYWLNQYTSLDPPPDVIVSTFQIELWMILLAAGCIVVFVLFALLLCLARRNRSAFRKFISVGLLSHITNGAVAIGVVVVKILVGVNLYFDTASTGYIVSYYVVMVIGILATIVDIVNRLRYVVAAMSSEDGIAFEDQAHWDTIILFGDFTTSALSDLPSLVIASAIIVDGTTGHIELVVALAVITAFVCGIKISDLPKIFTYVTQTGQEGEEDDTELLPVQGTEEFTEMAMSMKNIHAIVENPLLAVEPSASILASRNHSLGRFDRSGRGFSYPAQPLVTQQLPSLNDLPLDADEVTRARHLARIHAVTLKAEHFKRRTILKVYTVELLSCFKLGIEHMLLLLPTSDMASNQSGVSPVASPPQPDLLTQFSSLVAANERPWTPIGQGRRQDSGLIPSGSRTPKQDDQSSPVAIV